MEKVRFIMRSGQPCHATVVYQAGKCSVQACVSIGCFGITIDSLAGGQGLGRRMMDVASIADVAVNVTGTIVSNKTEWLPSLADQCETAREISLIVQILA